MLSTPPPCLREQSARRPPPPTATRSSSSRARGLTSAATRSTSRSTSRSAPRAAAGSAPPSSCPATPSRPARAPRPSSASRRTRGPRSCTTFTSRAPHATSWARAGWWCTIRRAARRRRVGFDVLTSGKPLEPRLRRQHLVIPSVVPSIPTPDSQSRASPTSATNLVMSSGERSSRLNLKAYRNGSSTTE